jgi:hypothetical protein
MKLPVILIILFAACFAGCGKLNSEGVNEGQSSSNGRLSKTFMRLDMQSLAIDGLIDPTTPTEFRDILDRHPGTKRIHLRSGGGEVTAAMEMGREIRKRGLDVVVDGRCYSSCANYLFVAGNRKSVSDGGMLLMHGGSSFNPERVFDQFPKATARITAIKAMWQLPFAVSEDLPLHMATYKAVRDKAKAQYLSGTSKNEEMEIQYFKDMGVTLDLINFSAVVCSCNATDYLEVKIELSNTKEKDVPNIAISTSSSAKGAPVWYVPPKQDWIASGVTNIDAFWTPSAAERALDFVKTGGKVRLETKPISELREADCIN